jgi:hypothetical protein
MPRSFFALCRINNQNEVRRIPLQAGVQAEIEQLFDQQEAAFLAGKNNDQPFDGNWTPDDNDLLVIEDAPLLVPFNDTLQNGPAAYNRLDVSNYDQAGIKAVFMKSNAVPTRILVQRFQSSQYLAKGRFTLRYDNNQFAKMTEHGFSLDGKLTAIIEGDDVKFVSFANLRKILTIQEHFVAATDAEVQVFKGHAHFHVENAALFDTAMDERSRKLIKGVLTSGVLANNDVTTIRTRAADIGLNIGEQNGRLILPGDKKLLKVILNFLEEGVFKGSFSNSLFETNSKRTVQ